MLLCCGCHLPNCRRATVHYRATHLPHVVVNPFAFVVPLIPLRSARLSYGSTAIPIVVVCCSSGLYGTDPGCDTGCIFELDFAPSAL
jgi:hypothetical protein